MPAHTAVIYTCPLLIYACRLPIPIINSRKAAVRWFRWSYRGRRARVSALSDRECLTISVPCSQITGIVPYKNPSDMVYGRVGHIYRPRPSAGSVISESTDAHTFLFIRPRFPIAEGNNGRKISVTSWSRTSAITIIIHTARTIDVDYMIFYWRDGPAMTAIPNPDVRVGIKRHIYIYICIQNNSIRSEIPIKVCDSLVLS